MIIVNVSGTRKDIRWMIKNISRNKQFHILDVSDIKKTKIMSEESGENYKSIQRYIWLARLNDDLLALVDHKRLGLGQGVSLSVLTAEEQRMVYEVLCRYPKFDLAVNRRPKRDGESDADFFHCTSFGKQAEFVERYFHSGSRVLVIGRVQNNNYTTRDILEEKRLTPNTTPYIL